MLTLISYGLIKAISTCCQPLFPNLMETFFWVNSDLLRFEMNTFGVRTIRLRNSGGLKECLQPFFFREKAQLCGEAGFRKSVWHKTTAPGLNVKKCIAKYIFLSLHIRFLLPTLLILLTSFSGVPDQG